MTTPDRRAASLSALLCAAVTLAACAPGASYKGPQFPFMPGYRAAEAGAPVLLSNAAWWQRLNDPVLNQLIDLALRDSLSLVLAKERVVQSRAELRAVPGGVGLEPSIGLQAEGSDTTDPAASGTARLGLSWMLDPYGAKRAERNAAGAQLEVADAEVDAAQLLVLFNITNAYVDLRYRQRLLALLQQELQSRQQTLALTRQMADASSATRLDTTRSAARVAEIQAQLPGVQAAVVMKLNEIAVLAGHAPGTLPLDLSSGGQPVPDLSPDVGIPADLLRNRPDIRIAERRYYAALAAVGVARAGLYPRLSLTGAITLNAFEAGQGGASYFFGPTVQFPSLPMGSARAGVEARSAGARQAHAAWQATVLTAILEVENALVDYKGVSDSLNAASRAARLYGEARDLTDEVFRRGDATLGDLIDAEQAVAGAQNALADARYRRALSFIALNVRLGSGHAAGRAE